MVFFCQTLNLSFFVTPFRSNNFVYFWCGVSMLSLETHGNPSISPPQRFQCFFKGWSFGCSDAYFFWGGRQGRSGLEERLWAGKTNEFCAPQQWPSKNWVVVSNIFYFNPYLGKIPNLTNIFQRGWFNHQLENGGKLPSHQGFILSPSRTSQAMHLVKLFPRPHTLTPSW